MSSRLLAYWKASATDYGATFEKITRGLCTEMGSKVGPSRVRESRLLASLWPRVLVHAT